jgi:hypothetical protein
MMTDTDQSKNGAGDGMTRAKILFLKTVDQDGNAYGGFRWPLKVGAVVTAPDFTASAQCGTGLHGLPWGEGDGSLLNWSDDAKWIVFSAPVSECVLFDRKGKCKTATICCVGSRLEATDYLMRYGKPGTTIVGGTATAGDGGTAKAGVRGTATAGVEGTATAGVGGTATAGDRGTATAGDRGTATAGVGGTATVGYRGTATAGDGGTATAGYGGTATAGVEGTATAGVGGTATAGDRGTILIRWHDGARYRVVTGYIGEDGLLPNVAYQFNATTGKFIKAQP